MRLDFVVPMGGPASTPVALLPPWPSLPACAAFDGGGTWWAWCLCPPLYACAAVRVRHWMPRVPRCPGVLSWCAVHRGCAAGVAAVRAAVRAAGVAVLSCWCLCAALACFATCVSVRRACFSSLALPVLLSVPAEPDSAASRSFGLASLCCAAPRIVRSFLTIVHTLIRTAQYWVNKQLYTVLEVCRMGATPDETARLNRLDR